MKTNKNTSKLLNNRMLLSFTLLLLLPAFFSCEETEEVGKIFEIVEESAAPAMGFEAFVEELSQNLNYPEKARAAGVEGKVYVQFVVNSSGELTDLQVVRGIGSGCDQEAVRALSKSDVWIPAKENGKVVNQRMVLPIHFKLDNAHP